MKQITNNIMMIKPVGFRHNEQTASNNYYQKVLDDLTDEQIQERAVRQFKPHQIFFQEITRLLILQIVWV